VPLQVKQRAIGLDWHTSCFPLTVLCLCPQLAVHIDESRQGLRSLEQIQDDLQYYAQRVSVHFVAYKFVECRWHACHFGQECLPELSLLIHEGDGWGHVAPLRGRVPSNATRVSSLTPSRVAPVTVIDDGLPDSGPGGPNPPTDGPDSTWVNVSPPICIDAFGLPLQVMHADLSPASYNVRSVVLSDAMRDTVAGLSYVPRRYRRLPGISIAPRVVLYDGYEEVTVVDERDRIRVLSTHYSFCWDGDHLVRGIAPIAPSPGLVGRLALRFASFLGLADTSAALNVRANDREVLTGLQFHRNMQRQTDIESIHQASVLYNRQMRTPEDSYNAGAVMAVMEVASMTRGTLSHPTGQRTLYGGGRRSAYLWGYCFSCGGFSIRRMRGRLCQTCQGTREGEPLVSAIRRGQHVATNATPLRYPGVVNMSSQHPPLKRVSTVAGPGDVQVHGATIEDILRMPPRDRPGPRLLGIGLNGAYPFCSSVGPRPLLEAILYRNFKHLPEREDPSEACFDSVTRVIDLLLPGFCDPCEPMSVFEWLRSYTVSRRRHALTRAHWKRVERGRNHQDYGKVGAFVKTEKLPWFKPVGGEPYTCEAAYIARLIQAPHDEAHLDAGPCLKPLVHRLKQVWHEGNWIFYGSRDPGTLDVWLSSIVHCRSFFWADYSAFDATHSLQSWRMIEGLYSRIYPREHYPALWGALDAWRAPTGKCKVRKEGIAIKYQCPPCNASGRDDTALANALFNGLCLAASFAAELSGVEIEDLSASHLAEAERLCRISVVGDDSIVGCSFDVTRINPVRHLKRFGLVVKAESSHYLGDVTYLGQMPYNVGGAWIWGPTLGRCLYKAFWQLERDTHPVAWLRGVAQQLSLFRHVPVLHEFAQRVLLLTTGPSTPVRRDPNRPWTMRDSPTPSWDSTTLVHLAKRYNVPSDLILGDIRLVQQVLTLPCVGRFPFLNVCVTQDDL